MHHRSMKTAAQVLISATLLAHAAVAWADESAADAYKRGQAAYKAGRVHEACEAYEASDKLEAKIETELSLAECYENDGRPMSAARLYRTLSEKDTNAARRKTSAAKATKLEAKAPKLRILVNQRPEGLVIKVDGTEVPATGDVRVDAGPHEVVATAPGFEGRANAAVDKDRAIVDVIVRLEPKAEPAPPPEPTAKPEPAPTPAKPETPAVMQPEPKGSMPAPPAESSSRGHRKRNGAIIGAAGVGALVGATVFFVVSQGKFDDEHTLCPGSQCANDTDLAQANSLLDDGHTYCGISIGMGIGGVALVGVGTYLILTSKKKSTQMSFNVGHDSAGFVYTGRF